jgi:hypothetical protein
MSETKTDRRCAGPDCEKTVAEDGTPIGVRRKYCGDRCRLRAFRTRRDAAGLIRTRSGYRSGLRVAARRLTEAEREAILSIRQLHPEWSCQQIADKAIADKVVAVVSAATVSRVTRREKCA